MAAAALPGADALHRAVEGHADQYRPLGSYVALIAAFNALAAGGLVAAGRAGRLPERIGPGDLALYGVASFKLARLVAKDRVTSGLRAPFTRFQEDSGIGEVEEAARGRGLQRAIGELLVCPECLGLWVSAGFVGAHVAAPRAARTAAGAFVVHAIADVLQQLQAAAK